MRRKNRQITGRALASVMIVGILASITIDASEVCVSILAEVAEVSDSHNLLEGEIQVNDTLTGVYRYDSATPDTNPAATVGDYWSFSPPYGIRVEGGSLVFESDPADVQFLIEIVNDIGTSPVDNYLLHSQSNLPLPNGSDVDLIRWQLDDFSATALSSPSLPTSPPVLADWQSIFGLTLEGNASGPGGGGHYFVRAHVTSATLCGAGAGAGAVPDGASLPGVPLLLDRLTGGDVQLIWGDSCSPGDSDYEVYVGGLGDFDSHFAALCSTSGAQSATVTPPASSVYYLIVPRNGANEGSYGLQSGGVQRPQAVSACLPQLLADCGP